MPSDLFLRVACRHGALFNEFQHQADPSMGISGILWATNKAHQQYTLEKSCRNFSGIADRGFAFFFTSKLQGQDAPEIKLVVGRACNSYLSASTSSFALSTEQSIIRKILNIKPSAIFPGHSNLPVSAIRTETLGFIRCGLYNIFGSTRWEY